MVNLELQQIFLVGNVRGTHLSSVSLSTQQRHPVTDNNHNFNALNHAQNSPSDSSEDSESVVDRGEV